MPPIKRVEISEETFAPGSSGPLHPITQYKCNGLTSLPSELLLDIIAYFPEISVANILDKYSDVPTDCRQRFSALRALSQTCKELRSVILPLAWERLEACTANSPMRSPFTEAKELAFNLERKCKGLLQSSHLIPYVRIVTISIVKYQVTAVLPALVECLHALTNLHTIQIVRADPTLGTLIKKFFEGRIFPSVCTMILPFFALDILLLCPNVEDLTWIDRRIDEIHLCDVLGTTKLTKLKTLRGTMPHEAASKRIAKIAPNLQAMRVFCSRDDKDIPNIEGFQNFKNLDTIEIQFTEKLCSPEYETTLKKRETYLVPIARDVLKASRSTRQKRIRLLYTQKEWADHGLITTRVFKEETLLL